MRESYVDKGKDIGKTKVHILTPENMVLWEKIKKYVKYF